MLFAKGHGTGNDFVILPDADGELALTPRWVAALCDRRRGIGADGVLRVVRTAAEPEAAAMAGAAEWFMDYRNADGSLAEMCGNGIRVFVRYLLEAGLARLAPVEAAAGAALSVATRSGVVAVQASTGGDLTADLPAAAVGEVSGARIGSRYYAGVAVEVGNPNLVCAVDDLDGIDLRLPPQLDLRVFPHRANVEFVRPATGAPDVDLHIAMRVYERGAAETLSCGSGACAAAAAVLREAGRPAGRVAVDVPGGRLTVTVEPDRCRLTGPAVIVATGDLDPAALGVPAPLPRHTGGTPLGW